MRRFVLAAAVAAGLAGCSPGGSGSAGSSARIDTADGSVIVHVGVADTPEARERGLKGVRDLAPDGGMAFVFDDPSPSSFWMKDTPLPLSIAFWGRDRRITAIMDMAPCRADPCPTYRPDRPFVGALEVHRGFFAANGVEVGDRIALAR